MHSPLLNVSILFPTLEYASGWQTDQKLQTVIQLDWSKIQ